MEHTQFDELVLTLETENTDENTTYEWTLRNKPSGGNSPSYTVDTAKAGQHNIQCKVSNTVDGFTYTSRTGIIIVKIQAFCCGPAGDSHPAETSRIHGWYGGGAFDC